MTSNLNWAAVHHLVLAVARMFPSRRLSSEEGALLFTA